jgi:hypothetical protein
MKLQVTPFIRELVQLGARNDATRLGRMNDYLRILAVLQCLPIWVWKENAMLEEAIY